MGDLDKAVKAGGSELRTDRGINAAVINHASLCKHDAYFNCQVWRNQFFSLLYRVICIKKLCNLFASSTCKQVSQSGASYRLRAIYQQLQRQPPALHRLFCSLIQRLQYLCRTRAPIQGRKRGLCDCVNRKFSSVAIPLQVHN